MFDRNRCDFLMLPGDAAVWPLAAQAQQPGMPVIGFPHGGPPTEWTHLVAAFNLGLNESSFAGGRNMTIEFLWANLQNDGLPAGGGVRTGEWKWACWYVANSGRMDCREFVLGAGSGAQKLAHKQKHG